LDTLQALLDQRRPSSALTLDVRLSDRHRRHRYAIRRAGIRHAEHFDRQRHSPAIVQDAPVASIWQITARPVQEGADCFIVGPVATEAPRRVLALLQQAQLAIERLWRELGEALPKGRNLAEVLQDMVFEQRAQRHDLAVRGTRHGGTVDALGDEKTPGIM